MLYFASAPLFASMFRFNFLCLFYCLRVCCGCFYATMLALRFHIRYAALYFVCGCVRCLLYFIG